MSLLTPSESFALQSFLSQIDYNDALDMAPEWSMYTAGAPHTVITNATVELEVPRRAGTEQLSKATKDLMALDTTPRWSESADRDLPHPHPHPHPPSASSSSSSSSFRPGALVDGQGPPQRNPNHRPTGSLRHADHPRAPPSNSPPPPRSYAHPPPLPPVSSKRPRSDSSASDAPPKKPRPAAPPPAQAGPVLQTKPSLLSPSQKKANHIQSEQKRRANIRRGYEALCETVPALREAIRVEEEAAAAVGNAAKGKKRQRGKKGQQPADEVEKIDGRAGPRSENVVLQKTIDYVNELLSEQSALLTRLHRARSTLARGHPALSPSRDDIPLWERKWSGGSGMDDNDGDGDSDEDDE